MIGSALRGVAIARHRHGSDEDTTGSGRTATATAWERGRPDDATVELRTTRDGAADDLDVPTRPARAAEGPTLELNGFTGFDEVLPGAPVRPEPVGAANEPTHQLVAGVTRTLPRPPGPAPEPEATVPVLPASQQATIRTPVASPIRQRDAVPAVARPARVPPARATRPGSLAAETKAGLLGLGVGTVLLLAVLGAVVLFHGT